MNARLETVRRHVSLSAWAAAAAMMVFAGSGCDGVFPPPGNDNTAGNDNTGDGKYGNSTDPTNRSAKYITSSACRECHEDISEKQLIHGHAHKLTRVQGEPPVFPEEATRAGVPNPPEGFEWADIAYVIGGYIRKGRFIDNDGFILTDGVNGVNTQWNLSFPANGTEPGFAGYEPDRETPKPYDFSCFQCHTTGAQPQNEDFPEFQENRPGFAGTWEEAGVQCEACHGPGGNHFTTVDGQVQVDTTGIFVSSAAERCGQCHTRGDDPNVIMAAGGYIQHHEQWPELLASGGHAGFDCITCHNPHVSANYDRQNAIINECTACHADQNLALHQGKTYVRGDYVETLSCVSCHMTFATKSAAAASAEVVGPDARMGDTKSHIFRISASPQGYTSFFTDDLSQVRKDSAGRAAVTVDFVCLRCHNGIGNAFELSITSASAIAAGMHEAR